MVCSACFCVVCAAVVVFAGLLGEAHPASSVEIIARVKTSANKLFFIIIIIILLLLKNLGTAFIGYSIIKGIACYLYPFKTYRYRSSLKYGFALAFGPAFLIPKNASTNKVQRYGIIASN